MESRHFRKYLSNRGEKGQLLFACLLRNIYLIKGIRNMFFLPWSSHLWCFIVCDMYVNFRLVRWCKHELSELQTWIVMWIYSLKLRLLDITSSNQVMAFNEYGLYRKMCCWWFSMRSPETRMMSMIGKRVMNSSG